MSLKVLILGTGKMGHDVGMFFLRRGNSVTWLSRNEDNLDLFRKKIEKEIRRTSLYTDCQVKTMNFMCATYHHLPESDYDLIIENVKEDFEIKRALIEKVKPQINEKTILASNSSSLLPGQINPLMIGLHFFYPLELNRLVEVIYPKSQSNQVKHRVTHLLDEAGLNSIIQTEQNAFAVNRLLLPLQAESLRLLQIGLPAASIEEFSQSELLPIGQLSLMDSIGLDLLQVSAKNYIERMPSELQKDYACLIQGLEILVGQGKLGKKNKNGFLNGSALPWPENARLKIKAATLKKRYYYLLINTLSRFLKSDQITMDELRTVFKQLFAVDITDKNFEFFAFSAEIATFLYQTFRETGRTYFLPVVESVA